MQKVKDKKGNFSINKATLLPSVRGFLVSAFADTEMVLPFETGSSGVTTITSAPS